MPLAESYTLKPGSIPAYFDAILNAQPPERFSLKFLENLGFTSTNDRLFIGVLKDLGFLNRDGAPQARYFDFLDRSQSKVVLASGIREGFGDLFAINTKAQDYKIEDIKNKLRTLFAGKKTDLVISNIARTFRALCDYGDFSKPILNAPEINLDKPLDPDIQKEAPPEQHSAYFSRSPERLKNLGVGSLQYHINILLPDTRDQSVYDAIFRSLRDHLG